MERFPVLNGQLPQLLPFVVSVIRVFLDLELHLNKSE